MKKRILSFLLAALMLFSLALCGSGAALADEGTDIDAQLNLIFSQIGNLLQQNGELTWYYTVTDLDHNGRLEFIAAAQHPEDRSTNLHIWEVTTDKTALTEDSVSKQAEESFPDILTDSTDTYHDLATDSWFYMFYDNVILSANEVFTSKSAYRLKDGVIGYLAYAVEHTVVENGYRNVTHMDQNGNSISAEQFNAAGEGAFSGCERSSTNFDWITAADANSLARLADCYAVFTGRKNAPQSFPVPKPAALEKPVATAAPSPSPAQNNDAVVYLSVTKNPTNENRKVGDTAYFVSCANAFDSLTWTMVAPGGGEYSIQNFQNLYPACPVSGQYSTTLSIGKLTADLNSWGAYCTFNYKGQTARTSTAYIYVTQQQEKKNPSGTYSGSVVDWTFSTVTVSVNGVNAVIPWGLCDVEGDLYYGASASVVYNGKDITYCYIKGSYTPAPTYGSMSGTIYSDTASTVYVVLQNGLGLHLNAYLVNWVSGSVLDGAGCTVYYTDYPSGDTVYQIDVYGYTPQPVYGTMNGTAYEGGGGFAIYLTNGSQVYVDSWLCNVVGTFYDGAGCVVEYIDYPSSDNIYSVTIYGNQGLVVDPYPVNNDNDYDWPSYDDFDYEDWTDYGGWAGSSTVTCPNCLSEVASAYDNCPNCGASLWS